MELIKGYQIRGVPGEVSRLRFSDRIVEYWAPQAASNHLLIAHDGQNVFDGKTSTHRGRTWEMAQHALKISHEIGVVPPVIIGVWHSSSKSDPWGRGKDLSPQRYFQDGISIQIPNITSDDLSQLHGDKYLSNIFDIYVPQILNYLNLSIKSENTAMIGSSMGGLSTLYAVATHPEKFKTALALSPHWPIGGKELVARTIKALPAAGTHKIWMSRGTKGLDATYQPFQELADQLTLDRGYRLARDFESKIFKKTGHNERSWASYLDQPLRFWLNS